jgi:hypothetical protein
VNSAKGNNTKNGDAENGDQPTADIINKTNKAAHESTDVDPIPDSAYIREWDLVTLGEPGSCEREEQVSEIERDAHDRARVYDSSSSIIFASKSANGLRGFLSHI